MKRHLVGMVCAGIASVSTALTMGPVRGDVWMEQPLEVVVPFQPDPGAEPGASVCASAEVSYGESLLDPRTVRVVQENAAEADGAGVLLRVQTSVPINEAVVTLLLQAGCTQKVSRRFQLLPDVARLMAPVPAAPPPLTEVPSPPPGSPEGVQPLDTVAVAPPPAPERRAAARSAASGSVAAPRRVRKRSSPAPVAATPAAAPAPRLSLDAVAVYGQRMERPEAASVAASPDAMEALEELQKLRADYRGLQERATRNEAEFAALRRHLEQAEADRRSVIWLAVGGFVTLVVLALGGLLWLGRRERAALAGVAGGCEFDAEATALLEDLHASAADRWVSTPKPTEAVVDEVLVPVDVDVTQPGPMEAARR